MTTLVTRGAPPVSATRDRIDASPPTVTAPFFRGRDWSWRSGPCTAADHSFEMMIEAPHDLKELVRPIITPLQTLGQGQPQHSYRIVHRRRPGVQYALYYDCARLMIATSPEPLVRLLTWHINRQTIDQSSLRHVVLHAAAATRAGVTVILPGDQEQGKTTTVAGLLREGYQYVTDEAVAIDPTTLCITPFPKALSIDHGSWHLFPECRPNTYLDSRQWQVPAELLGSQSVQSSVRPAEVVVFPQYVANSTTRVLPLSPAEAVRELAQTAFHFERQPARNLRTLAAMVRSSTVSRLRIGSLDDAVLAIEQLVSETLLKEM